MCFSRNTLRSVLRRRLQVNGQDVTNDDYEGVVAKIKAMPTEAHLLVADPQTYEHFKRSEQHRATETTQIYVEVIACPDEPVETSGCDCYVAVVIYLFCLFYLNISGKGYKPLTCR